MSRLGLMICAPGAPWATSAGCVNGCVLSADTALYRLPPLRNTTASRPSSEAAIRALDEGPSTTVPGNQAARAGLAAAASTATSAIATAASAATRTQHERNCANGNA